MHFEIQDARLRGIVGSKQGYTAMLTGLDGKSRFCRAGLRLVDGYISSVQSDRVVFRQEIRNPLSTVRSRDVIKSLYSSEPR